MKGREQLYFAATLDDAKRAGPELEKLGFRLKKAGRSGRSLVYYDTQDGRLFNRDRRCINRIDSNTWELHRSNGDVLSIENIDGPFFLGDAHLFPLLAVRIEAERIVLSLGQNAHIEMEYQIWYFSNPHDDERGGQARVLSVGTDDAPAELAYVRTVLMNICDLEPFPFDPLRRGLHILQAPLPGAPIPGEYLIDRDDSMGDLAHKTLGRQAYVMWANTEGTARDLDVEFLHDLRVATRRGRFALKTLKGIVESEFRELLRGELKWIASLLGDVRDLDVFLDYLQEHFKRIEAGGDMAEKVTTNLIVRRKPALEMLREALRSSRYEAVLEKMRSVKDHLEEGSAVHTPALSVAPVYIRRAYKKVTRYDENPTTGLSARRLHRLRIDFKGLRYTCEFFAGLYGDEMKPFIDAVKKFQDCLGAYQDAQVAKDTLTDLLGTFESQGSLSDTTLLAMGALIQVEREISIAKREEFYALWATRAKLKKTLERVLSSGGSSPADRGER